MTGAVATAAREALAEACDGRVDDAGATDLVGATAPRWVVRPTSTAEVAAVMHAAHQHDLAVVVRGSGTKLAWGRDPERLDLLLDTTGLDALVEHASGDLIAVVGAGRRLADLQDDLAGAGQRLGVDPARAGTVGGAVATAATGPMRLAHGAVRDLVIGMTIVRADGVVAHSGGKVVKNVAGYDLGKLLTGSFGTLGVVTEVAFRLHPVPAGRTWVTSGVSSPVVVRGVVRSLVHSQVVPSAVELDRPAGADGCVVSVLLEGHPEGLDARAAEVESLLGHGATRTSEPPPWWGREPVVDESVVDESVARESAPASGAGEGRRGALLKVTHELAALPHVLDALTRAESVTGREAAFRGSVAVGTAAVAVDGTAEEVAELTTALRASAPGFGGAVVLLEGPPGTTDLVDPWGPVGGLGLMQAVKQQFDPGRQLAPGRFVGGI